jgi:hypothetical protein
VLCSFALLLIVPSFIIPIERIHRSILLIRGERVLLDADLTDLYGVPTKAITVAIRRNQARFPADFAFRLTKKETSEVASTCRRLDHLKFSRSLPLAFTEHGAIMAANVLRSQRAIDMSVYVVRAFIQLRRLLGSHADLARELMTPPEPKRKSIGYHTEAAD